MNPSRQKLHLYSRLTTQLSPHQRRIFALLKADEATHIDEIVDRLETEMSSSESSQLFSNWSQREK